MEFNRIAYMRDSMELNQRDMAKMLGVPKATYASWEIDRFVMPLKNLVDLCNVSKFSLDFALGLSNDRKNLDKKIEIDYKKIGKKIKKIRIDNNLSQKEFAKILNTSDSAISRYEKGQTKRLTVILHEICIKFNVSLDYLCE